MLLDLPYGPSEYVRWRYPAICDLRKPPRGEIQPFNSYLFVDEAYDDTCIEVDKVMTSINTEYEYVRKYGLACLVRKNWCPTITIMTYRINFYT